MLLTTSPIPTEKIESNTTTNNPTTNNTTTSSTTTNNTTSSTTVVPSESVEPHTTPKINNNTINHTFTTPNSENSINSTIILPSEKTNKPNVKDNESEISVLEPKIDETTTTTLIPHETLKENKTFTIFDLVNKTIKLYL